MKCVHADTVYTGTSVKHDMFLCFEDNTVKTVSKEKKGELVGEYEVITPCFIDPHSHIGMRRAGEPGAESESNEKMDSIIPLPDALDSVQMDDTAFKDSIEMGVLYSCVVPGSGNIIGGLSAVIRNYAEDTSKALIARAGIKCAFGYNPMSTSSWKGDRPSTRMGAVALLRDKLHSVTQKINKFQSVDKKKRKEITFEFDEKIIRDILEGKKRLRVHVHKSDDIASLLRLQEEFDIPVQIEHASDVHNSLIFEKCKKKNIPVTYGPIDSFAYKVELKHENWRNIQYLLKSGVTFGLMTDHPVTLSRQLFLQTRWFLRCGLSKQEAIELVSRKNAEILGIDNILGTLKKGKWASFTGWNGDPFDLASYPVSIFAEGKLIKETK